MGTNFEVGQVNSFDFEDDDDTELEENNKNNKDNNELKQKLIKIMVLVGGALIILLLILFVISLFNKKNYTYEQMEKVLENAAISYFKQYPESLPTSENQVAEITSETLIKTGKMEDFTEYGDKVKNCTGRVEVTKRGTEYLYTPYLTCGSDYTAQKLSSTIIAASNVVTEGYGLHKVNNEYIYKGEKVNNYIQIDGRMWRVVKVTSDESVVAVLDDSFTNQAPWDNRYNTELKYNIGINNFASSRLKETIEAIYNNEILDSDDEPLLSNYTKSKLNQFSLCTGKRSAAEATKDNSVECKAKADGYYIGLLTVSDYMNASIDANCTSTTAKSCQNYNDLNNKSKFWLITAVENTTSKAYYVNESGNIIETSTGDYAYVRPVIYLSSKTMIREGDGTFASPYIIK